MSKAAARKADVFVLLTATLVFFSFAACLSAGGAAWASETIVFDLEKHSIPGWTRPLARAELAVDIEKNGNLVQIPQLAWNEGCREVGLLLNRKILAHVGEYEAHLDSPGNIEIRSYHYVMGPSFINIIIIKDMSPRDGNIGEIKTFVYDYRFDEIHEQSALLEAYEVDIGAVNAWMMAGGWLPEGETALAAELSGAVIGFMELDMLYTVSVSTAEGAEERRLYVGMDKEDILALS